MGAPSEVSWDMYDPRTTIKVEAAEDLKAGYACYIASNGKAYHCDDSINNQFHGCALKATSSGDKVTLVTHGRLNVIIAQTIGNKAKVTTSSGGNTPSTTLSGVAAGFAIAEYVVFVHAEPQGNNS